MADRGEIIRFPLQGELDETIINPEILPAVRALRGSGIETIASNSGIDQIDLEHGWGSLNTSSCSVRRNC